MPQVTTILTGVTQQRKNDLPTQTYFQYLGSPQGLQLDTSNVDNLTSLFFSDYETGYIYTVGGMPHKATCKNI